MRFLAHALIVSLLFSLGVSRVVAQNGESIAVTITSVPAGLSVMVDGASYPSPHAVTWTAGSAHTIGALTVQSGGAGVQYVWNRWNDGGAMHHSVAPTVHGTTYTVTYTTQFFLTTRSGFGGGVSPSSQWVDSGAQVAITAFPEGSNQFFRWTGSGAGSYSGTDNPATVTMQGPMTLAAAFLVSRKQSQLDFDGDGTSDLGVFHATTGNWYVRQSSDGQMASGGPMVWGVGGIPQPGDYDGDGITDLAVYVKESGLWYIRSSIDFEPIVLDMQSINMIPVSGDYDGDGRMEPAVYDNVRGSWFIWSDQSQRHGWGWSETIPVPADYDGDGRTDQAVYWPKGGQWSIRQSRNYEIFSGAPFAWGWKDAIPVPGDYDGDGLADIAVYAPAGGTWHIRKSSTGTLMEDAPIVWGAPKAMPVPADYDNDGRTDLCVYVALTGKWYIRSSLDGTLLGGGNNAQNGGISWGHPVVTPFLPLYQALKAKSVVP